jgi:hypothetical protein
MYCREKVYILRREGDLTAIGIDEYSMLKSYSYIVDNYPTAAALFSTIVMFYAIHRCVLINNYT